MWKARRPLKNYELMLSQCKEELHIQDVQENQIYKQFEEFTFYRI